METLHHEKHGFLGGVARLLNTGGAATVKAYDTTSEGLSKLKTALHKVKVPAFKEKTWGELIRKKGLTQSGKISHIEKLIQEHERQIKIRYFQIGKKSSEAMEYEKPEDSEAVRKLLLNVKGHEQEITKLKAGIIQVREEEAAQKLRKKEQKREEELNKLRKKGKGAFVEQVDTLVKESLNQAITAGEFESPAEQESFYKVACDLLDHEIEIKCLAAAELGKMGNANAVQLLIHAAGYNDPELISEIVNALIALGDNRAIKFFSKGVNSPKYRVRISCIAGLVKMADDETVLPVLTNALEDEHPEVRRTALTFIGWKKYEEALSAVVPSLQDPVPRVRKTAVSTLASLQAIQTVPLLINMLMDRDMEIREKALAAIQLITGRKIEFDIMTKGERLKESLRTLKENLGYQDDKAPETAENLETGKADEVGEERSESFREPDPDEKSEFFFSESRLKKMSKAELTKLCEQLGIEYGEISKSKIIQLIIAAQ